MKQKFKFFTRRLLTFLLWVSLVPCAFAQVLDEGFSITGDYKFIPESDANVMAGDIETYYPVLVDG